MKSLFVLIGCLTAFNSIADEIYVAPTELSPTETDKAVNAYISNATTRDSHNKARLELAKQNKQKMATPGTPLQKPYFGDTPMH